MIINVMNTARVNYQGSIVAVIIVVIILNSVVALIRNRQKNKAQEAKGIPGPV